VRYPRPMLPATAIIGVIALLIAAVAAVAQWRHERQVSQIEISIRHDPEHCEFGRPLRVEVHNRSTRTVTGMSWQLRASQAGYSAATRRLPCAVATAQVIWNTGQTRSGPGSSAEIQQQREQGQVPMNKPVALITGCSSGIGQALAQVCLDEGYTVYATARN